MTEPRLSIVTITYHDANGLARTLDSLRPLVAAARGDWEHVIVDSSPEDNRGVLAGVPAGEWPLRHLTVPPGGVYAAQNEGLRAARGRLVWFLNGGDRLIDPKALTDCLEAFDSELKPDVVVAAVELHRDSRPAYVQHPRAHITLDLVGRNRVCHQGVIYRREVFDRVGNFSTRLRLAADYDHLLRCLAGGLRVIVRPNSVLAAYEVTGQSSTRFRETFREFRQIHRAQVGRLPLLFSLGNELVRPLEQARVSLVKAIGANPVGARLRSLYHAFKRLR